MLLCIIHFNSSLHSSQNSHSGVIIISLLCVLYGPLFLQPPKGSNFFFFKFPYWLKEHFRGLKSISLFTEAIKTSLQLFPVALALKQEHSGTSNYSFEEHSLSSRARHFPSHSLQFRQPGHCRWQVSQNQTIQWTASKPATRTLWAGFRLTGGFLAFSKAIL